MQMIAVRIELVFIKHINTAAESAEHCSKHQINFGLGSKTLIDAMQNLHMTILIYSQM